MKKAVILLAALLICDNTHAQTRAFVNRESKAFVLTSNIRDDYKFFGYAAPNSQSKKLILFSVFTSEVQGNPKGYVLGAYYQTLDLKPGDKIVFISKGPAFVKLNFITSTHKITPFYIKREFVEFG